MRRVLKFSLYYIEPADANASNSSFTLPSYIVLSDPRSSLWRGADHRIVELRHKSAFIWSGVLSEELGVSTSYVEREIDASADSRRITQFYCPNLSEKAARA